MDLRLVLAGPGLRPTRGDIGGREGLDPVAHRVAAVVRDEIHLKKAGAALIPGREGADGDLMFQERPRLRARAASDLKTPAILGEQAVDGGRRDLQEFLLDLKETGAVPSCAP